MGEKKKCVDHSALLAKVGRMHRLREILITETRSPPNITWPRQWPIDTTENAVSESPFRTLPTEVTLQIFRQLSAHELCHVSLVCRRFKMIADHDELWKAKCNSE